jgi:type VI secretion system protein VasD
MFYPWFRRLCVQARFAKWGAAACALLWLAACSDAPPRREMANLQIKVSASDRANPDEQGRAAPVMVRIFELKSTHAFENADFFTLQVDNKSVLGDDALATDEFILRPGDVRTLRRLSNPSTTAIGVLAGYRDLGKSVWRTVYRLAPLPEASWYRSMMPRPKVILNVMVGPRAVSVTEVNGSQ